MEKSYTINDSISLQKLGMLDYMENIDKVIQYLEDYSKTWSDESYNMFLKSFNEYLAQITPIEYRRPIIKLDPLYDLIPLWGIRFEREKLRRLLVKIVETKCYPSVSNIVELRKLLYDFLSEMGVENPEDVLRQCSDFDENCLIYLAIVALVIATNP